MTVPWLHHSGPQIVQDKRRFVDPVTGDPLTLGEELSWLAQGIIRRWTFLGLITVATVVSWFGFGGRLQFDWNLAASYMALLIEGTVGIAMFSQTRRDALVIRHIRDVIDRQEAIIERLKNIEALGYKIEKEEEAR